MDVLIKLIKTYKVVPQLPSPPAMFKGCLIDGIPCPLATIFWMDVFPMLFSRLDMTAYLDSAEI